MADKNNTKSNTPIAGTNSADSITNSGDDVTVTAYNGNDTITNSGERAEIYSGDGRNFIENSGKDSTVRTGTGDSTVHNSLTGTGTLIELGWGDNIVENLGEYVTVQGGGEDDRLYNSADNVTARGNSGDDFIQTGNGKNFVYEFDPRNDEHDTIAGFNETSTLKIINSTTATYKRITVGNDVVIKFDDASVTLLDAANLTNLNIQDGTEVPNNPVSSDQNKTGSSNNDVIENRDADGIVIDALEGDDNIDNYKNEVTISGGDGDDFIFNNGKFNSISGGDGNDHIQDNIGIHNTIDGGDGNDIINVLGERAWISGDGDNDSISVSGKKNTVIGGAGDDTVETSANAKKSVIWGDDGDDLIKVNTDDVTVGGNRDNDTIKILNAAKNTFIEYNNGDGDDIVEGFNETSWLQIGGANYTSTKSGDDIIFNVDTGSIILKDAAKLSNLNIDGFEDSNAGEENPPDNPPSDNPPDNPADNGNIIWGTPNKDNIPPNSRDDMIIYALEDDDTVINSGNRVSIEGGEGNDSITNSGDNVTIKGGEDNDTVNNSGYKTSIDAGDGDNQIFNSSASATYEHRSGESVTIKTGAGNDFISNDGSDVLIDAGDGSNTVENARYDYQGKLSASGNATIKTGAGNDSVLNTGTFSSVVTGDGADTVDNSGFYTHVETGNGDDSVLSHGDNSTIETGAGNDSIYNHANLNATSSTTIDAGDDDDYVYTDGGYDFIDAGEGNNTIESHAYGVTVLAGSGNDSVNNTGAQTSIKTGAGNDVVNNLSDNESQGLGQACLIDTGDGNDIVYFKTSSTTILGGEGNDSISNGFGSGGSSILAGAGSDTVTENTAGNTIDAGDGDDYIKINSKASDDVITLGEGADTIHFDSQASRFKIQVNDFGTDDQIKLDRAANSISIDQFHALVVNSVTPITIKGITQVSTEKNSWRIENGVAIYSAQTTAGAVLSADSKTITWTDGSTQDLIRINGLKNGLTVNADGSIDGLTLSGNKVTVTKDVLGTSEVTISDGYEFQFTLDVPRAQTTAEHWSVLNNASDGTTSATSTAIYQAAGTSEGYTIVDSNKIVYSAATGGDTFTLTGLAPNLQTNSDATAINGITVTDDNIIKLSADLLCKSDVTLNNPAYHIDPVNYFPPVNVLNDYWAVDATNKTATYYTSGTSEGYTYTDQKITYHPATNNKSSVTVTGIAEGVTAVDGRIEGLYFGGKTFVVSPQVMGENFAIPKGYEITFMPGDYAGKMYNGLSANDTIEIHGDNLKVDSGNGNDVFNITGDGDTVFAGAGNDTVDIGGDNAFIDGGTGNDKIYMSASGGTIAGGKGNDKITSDAAGGNVYQYANGDGKDTIWGYSDNDTIQFTDDTTVDVSNFTVKNGNLIIKIGSGSITLKDAALDGKEFTFADKDGNELGHWTYYKGMFVENGTGYLMDSAKGIFATTGDVTNSAIDVLVQNIDGSLAKSALTLTGDTNDNSLIGGEGNDTLIGNGGEDTFVGGKGNDLFAYNGGNVTIVDYGNGSDKVSLTSSSGNGDVGNSDVVSAGTTSGFDVNGTDVILQSDTGTVTIKDALGKKVTIVENGKSSTGIFNYDGKTNTAGTSITLASSNQCFAATTKLVTIDGSLVTNATIAGNEKSNKIFGGAGDDMLRGFGGNDTFYGGAGSDIFIYDSGKNVILDFNGDEDKLVIGMGKVSSSSVNSKGDVVLKVGTGSVTVKKLDDEDISDGKTITILDDGGETSYTYFSEKIVSADGKVTLNSNFKGSAYTADENISEVDASAVTKKFAITGNDDDNTITGGKGANLIDGGDGDDVLIGGAGKDTFVVSAGDDTISDYLAGTDKISLGSAQIKNYSIDDGKDVILYFDGGNSLTIQDSAGDKITLIENGKSVVNVYAADGIFNNTTTTATAATLAADTKIFIAANYSKLTSIDGSAVTGEVEILGNNNANKIYAGDSGSTLNGGGGNDSLWGGKGSDTFIYNPGGDKDVIYDFGAEDMLQIGAEFTASRKNNSVVFKVGTTANAITLKDFSGTEFVANGDTYRLNGSTFTKQ